MRILFTIVFFFISGCTTINVTANGNVTVDAHKDVTVSDPSATVGLPLL